MNESVMNNGAGPRISPWRAVLRVLTDPGETFRAMAEKPPVLAPYVVHMLAGLVYMVFAYRPTLDLALQASLAAMPPGQQADFETMRTVMQWSAGAGLVGSALAGPWVAGFVISLVAMFFGQFQGGGVPLTSYFGMVGYARLPLAILTLLMGVFTGITGRLEFDLSPAVLLPETASPVLAALLHAFNPLHLWYYVLLGIGFASLFGREPRKGWILPVALFVITTLFQMGSAAVSASLMMTMN